MRCHPLSLAAFSALLFTACGDSVGPVDVEQPCPGDLVRDDDGTCVAPGVEPSACDPDGLRIDEVLANPDGADDGFEYIELRGRTDQSMDGLRLIRFDASGTIVAENALEGRADALGVFVIGGTATDADQALEGTILNDAGAIQLVDCDGNVVDAVLWGVFADGTARPGEGDPAPVAPEGSAIGRCALAEDTNNNADDFGVTAPSPGQPNPGEGFIEDGFCGESTTSCVPGALAGRLRIEEVLYNPEGTDTDLEFIELRGEPNMAVDGVLVEGVNGANGFTFFEGVVLAGSTDDNGLFVLGGSDVPESDFPLTVGLQNGPDSIVVTDCDGRTRLDAVGYGNFTDEHTFAGEGSGPGTAAEGMSLSRCAAGDDTGDNSADFGAATPSPGALPDAEAFADPFFCGGATECTLGELDIEINEVRYDVEGSETDNGGDEFIELRGTPGAPVDGASVVAINGNNGEPYGDVVRLTGAFNDDGLYLIGAENFADADAALTFGLQGGPDSLVVYDCDGETAIDALAYGNFGEGTFASGEGDAAPSAADGATLARCADRADTDDNATDFGVATATPGALNDGFEDPLFCEEAPDCTLGNFADVRINEALTNPSGADEGLEFIELRGAPNAAVNGLMLEVLNGTGGTSILGPVRLDGTFDDNGYFVLGGESVAEADQTFSGAIQNGPESIVLYDCDGESVVDALGYGNFDDEDVFVGEGTPAPTGDGESMSRCEDVADSDDNGADFGTATPTPGAANTGFEDPLLCVDVGPCVPAAAGSVLLNEILYNPAGPDAGFEFVELLTAANASLTGFVLVGINGSTGDEYLRQPLLGDADDSGFFVVGGATVPEADLVMASTIQNGPDSLQVLDCAENVVDAVGYGTFGENVFAGEGTAAASASDTSIGRTGGADTDDNGADFVEQTAPSPGAANE